MIIDNLLFLGIHIIELLFGLYLLEHKMSSMYSLHMLIIYCPLNHFLPLFQPKQSMQEKHQLQADKLEQEMVHKKAVEAKNLKERLALRRKRKEEELVLKGLSEKEAQKEAEKEMIAEEKREKESESKGIEKLKGESLSTKVLLLELGLGLVSGFDRLFTLTLLLTLTLTLDDDERASSIS